MQILLSLSFLLLGTGVIVTFETGTEVSRTVDFYGTWTVSVPDEVTLLVGENVYVNQTEPEKVTSDNGQATIQQGLSIYPYAEIFAENLSQGSTSAQAGYLILYQG